MKPLREKTFSSRSRSGVSPARAFRQASTAAATYSGRRRRPSIFRESTPASSRARAQGMRQLSLRERA